MFYYQIIMMPVLSMAVLFILSRIIGYRQMSQLSQFDYINGITIGSIASEVAISPFKDVARPLAALIVMGLLTFIFAVISDKSVKARRVITGKPIVLVLAGKFYEEGFSKARLDLNEFLVQCRNQGYFDIAQIDTAIMEPNGTVSILPRSQARPVTPEDMNYVIEQETILANVIIDGTIQEQNLKAIGFDKKWLLDRLKERKADLGKIFIATCDFEGVLNIYNKEGKKTANILG